MAKDTPKQDSRFNKARTKGSPAPGASTKGSPAPGASTKAPKAEPAQPAQPAKTTTPAGK